jgi:adenylosuccinate synthase
MPDAFCCLVGKSEVYVFACVGSFWSVISGKKFAFHLLPSGILHKHTLNFLGNGVVVDFPRLLEELKVLDDKSIDWRGRLLISNRAHVVLPCHKWVDAARETSAKATGDAIGTTRMVKGRGCRSESLIRL